MAAEALFELSILGGALERRWRRQRPDIERLPWDTLDPAAYPPGTVLRARRFWTVAAFQEYRTAAACAATVEALIAARAPIDLVAECSRFLLDETAHVELCARVAAALGGGAALRHDPDALFLRPSLDLSPLVRAAELVVRVFCVGETFSVPMQRATARAATHPLLRAVIARIAKDEAAHGAFGWTFLDWAGADLDDAARAGLSRAAASAIAALEASLEGSAGSDEGPTLGWLPRDQYLTLARTVMEEQVRAPLRARGLLDGTSYGLRPLFP
ncbi:MAG: hypothetical protein EXR72_13215 [Myxococcales bacterium]|nr:hypothetical protein [Myxococcales bacterium]